MSKWKRKKYADATGSKPEEEEFSPLGLFLSLEQFSSGMSAPGQHLTCSWKCLCAGKYTHC